MRPDAGAPLAEGMYRPLTEPVEAWHFAMRWLPEESGRRHLDLKFTVDGIFNAVLFWHTLELAPGVTVSSAPRLGSCAGTVLVMEMNTAPPHELSFLAWRSHGNATITVAEKTSSNLSTQRVPKPGSICHCYMLN